MVTEEKDSCDHGPLEICSIWSFEIGCSAREAANATPSASGIRRIIPPLCQEAFEVLQLSREAHRHHVCSIRISSYQLTKQDFVL